MAAAWSAMKVAETGRSDCEAKSSCGRWRRDEDDEKVAPTDELLVTATFPKLQRRMQVVSAIH